jgi:hypothetical protein
MTSAAAAYNLKYEWLYRGCQCETQHVERKSIVLQYTSGEREINDLERNLIQGITMSA